MKIKTGDNVKVISGRSAGMTGKVIQVFRSKTADEALVVIEGVNLRKKHIRARRAGEKGQILELASPVHASNVMLIDPASKKPTRVGYKIEGKEKKRISKKSGEYLG